MPTSHVSKLESFIRAETSPAVSSALIFFINKTLDYGISFMELLWGKVR